MIIVDASMALSWGLDEMSHSDADAALEAVGNDGAYVPGNFFTEVAHALINAERRLRVDAGSTSALLTDILMLPIITQPPSPYIILDTARSYKLTGYDAAYLALALQLNVPIATIDGPLREAAKTANLLWEPPTLN